jgi:hypothetical protein
MARLLETLCTLETTTGRQRTAPHRTLRRAMGGLIAASLLGGCGMSSLTSGLGGGMFGGSSSKSAVDKVTEEQMLSAAKADEAGATGSTSVGEVAHGCPKFVPWPRENHITIYEQGRVGDALAVMHRGEITKTARECQIEPGKVTVKYGFSGRVLLGPKGKGGNVMLPVTVTVTDAKRAKVLTDQSRVDAAVALDKPIGYFSAVRTVTFTVPEGARPGDFEVFVGFDRATPGAG